MVRKSLINACLFSLLLGLPGLCQSLADLAKKEREKQQGKPRKVYTNDDLAKYEDLRTSTPANPVAQPSESVGAVRKDCVAWARREQRTSLEQAFY